MSALLESIPLVIAPFALVLLNLVSAYVLKLGRKHTGIYFDYVLLAIFVILALVIGGAI